MYKAASTPFMAIISKLKSILTPRIQSQIRKEEITFIDLGKRFRFAHPYYDDKILNKYSNDYKNSIFFLYFLLNILYSISYKVTNSILSLY